MTSLTSYAANVVQPASAQPAEAVDLAALQSAMAEFDRFLPEAFEPLRVTQKQLDNLRKIALVWEREDGGFASDLFRGMPIVIDEANPSFPGPPGGFVRGMG